MGTSSMPNRSSDSIMGNLHLCHVQLLTLSTDSSAKKLMNPKPLGLLLSWSYITTASSTAPNCSKYFLQQAGHGHNLVASK